MGMSKQTRNTASKIGGPDDMQSGESAFLFSHSSMRNPMPEHVYTPTADPAAAPDIECATLRLHHFLTIIYVKF